MITTSSFTQRHPSVANVPILSHQPASAVPKSQDNVTFSGKHQHTQQPKLNPKTLLTLGLAALGLGGMANAFPVNKNGQALQAAQPTPAPNPFAVLPDKRSVACPACTDFLPPEEDTTTSTKPTTSSAKPTTSTKPTTSSAKPTTSTKPTTSSAKPTTSTKPTTSSAKA